MPRVTFPHMGTLYIGLKGILEELGIGVVVPPPTNEETVFLGAKYSPETACYPLKLNLGNFIQAHRMGADTIIMGGGTGPCRFGYYAQVQREILEDLGYHFEWLVIEPPRGHVGALLRQIKELTGNKPWGRIWQALKLGWAKFKAIDDVDRVVHRIRPREKAKGSTSKVLKQVLPWIETAKTIDETAEAAQEAIRVLGKIPLNAQDVEPLKVGIVGEIFIRLEPAANLGLEEKLGHLGVEIERNVYLSDWIRANLFLDALRFRRGERREQEVIRAASPYLKHFVGGEGLESVGHTVLFAKEGFDGVIHVLPFTCTPEIVAKSILPAVSDDLDIPVLVLTFDEHSGEAGLQTRLEAFTDLLLRRRERGRKEGGGIGVGKKALAPSKEKSFGGTV